MPRLCCVVWAAPTGEAGSGTLLSRGEARHATEPRLPGSRGSRPIRVTIVAAEAQWSAIGVLQTVQVSLSS